MSAINSRIPAYGGFQFKALKSSFPESQKSMLAFFLISISNWALQTVLDVISNPRPVFQMVVQIDPSQTPVFSKLLYVPRPHQRPPNDLNLDDYGVI